MLVSTATRQEEFHLDGQAGGKPDDPSEFRKEAYRKESEKCSNCLLVCARLVC